MKLGWCTLAMRSGLGQQMNFQSMYVRINSEGLLPQMAII